MAMNEFVVGSTFFATQHRLEARWHITGEIVSHSQVRIDRIWREDNRADWALSWSETSRLEEDGRIRALILGDPDWVTPGRRPLAGSAIFRVVNPKGYHDYNSPLGVPIEVTTPAQRRELRKAMSGDAALASLLSEWRSIRKKIDDTNVTDDNELDNWCRILDSIEEEIVEVSSSSVVGVQCKLEVVKHYTEKPVETFDLKDFIRSIDEDLQNI